MENNGISICCNTYKVKSYTCNKDQYISIIQYAFYNFVKYVVHSVMIDNIGVLYLLYIPNDEDNIILHDVLFEISNNKLCKSYKVYNIYNRNKISWKHFFNKISCNYFTDMVITIANSRYSTLIVSEDNDMLTSCIEKLI